MSLSLDLIKQFEKMLWMSKNVLIFLPENPKLDALGAGWASYFFLEKKGIKPTIVFSNGLAEERLDFIARPDDVRHSLSGARDFVLIFNTSDNKIVDLKVEKTDDELRIYITPEKETINPRDFSFVPAKYKYDLAIVLGCPSKESLGKTFIENPDVFYEIPVINIDNRIDNEEYGQLNIVDIKASSVSEILAEIFEKTDPAAIEGKIAECLLAGIIGATEGFRNTSTTPKTLKLSAFLIDAGADQQKIIRYLFKNQTFQDLKILGKIMAKMEWDEDRRLAWSSLTKEDMTSCANNDIFLVKALEGLEENYSIANYFLLFCEISAELVKVLIKCRRPDDAVKLQGLFETKPIGALLEINISSVNLSQAENLVLDKLRKFLSK